MTMLRAILFCALVFSTSQLLAQGKSAKPDAAKRNPVSPDPLGRNPIEAVDTVFIEDMTWMEVRDAMAGGKTTVIIATGGIEQNGPYLVTGKHNVILRGTTELIARRLGNALVAPIVPFVPEGDIDPPSLHMKYPGTISLTEETFRRLLIDICASFRTHGFKNIILLGDSGGNQRGMAAVAEDLDKRWAGSGVAVHFVIEYYTPGWEETEKYTEDVLGVSESRNDGHHDDIWVTAMMMVTDPSSVRYHERVEADLASINGVDIAPMEDTIELGRKMVEFRAEYTANAIRKSIADK